MCRVQRVSNLHAEVDELIDGKRPAANQMLQRLPFEPLHHDEVLVAVEADVVDRADVRVIECRRGARSALKAFDC
jgi:hypothetical protein